MSYVAFVPARSGSKRLPGKNIKLLGGKPLFVWTLEACINATAVSKVVFSTDSAEYLSMAKKFIDSPKLILHQRSPDHAGDQVKIFDYLVENIDSICSNSNDTLLLALPTLPFRDHNDVSNAIKLHEKYSKPIFSAIEYDFHTSFAFSLNHDLSWNSVLDESPMLTGNTRSQDQVVTYHPNGAIYLRDVRSFKNPKLKTIYDDSIVYVMNRMKSIDIDTEADFNMAEVYLKYATNFS